ncbi:hypothetical protein BASA61_005161 [Batrachochytrium salamandrivorans]|nr:hypothetical protein BASA61_005161 [Batrachochytrium salamandrivorans]
MQLFYLLPFVGVVSHAAALPQPAELSDKYSSNVDITLASFLGARSYHPVLDPQEDSATLVSLKRRDNSDGNSGGLNLPPLLTPEGIQEVIDKFFTDDDLSSVNMSATIDRVGDGAVGFYKDGEKAGKEIGDPAGPMLARSIDRAIYVYVALIEWIKKKASTIFLALRPLMSEADFSEMFKPFMTAFGDSAHLTEEKEREVAKAVSNILTKTGTVIENVTTIHTSFVDIFASYMWLFDKLRSPLKEFESTKILYKNLSNAMTSLGKFLTEQQKIHDNIIKALEPPPSK